MTTDAIEELIKEVAAKHNIAVSRDDPIFILQTINSRLMQDSAQAQKMILKQYKEELEEISHNFCQDIKIKAERIINTSIAASKETSSQLMQEGIKANIRHVHSEIEKALKNTLESIKNNNRIAYINIIASFLTCTSVMIAILAIFIH